MIRIDKLPDDVLLEIFYFYVDMGLHYGKPDIEAWQSLVHVCQRWRTLVFGSPRRLDLKLYCSSKTPAKDTLDIWPALPLIIDSNLTLLSNNIIAALEQSDRVCRVSLRLTSRKLEEVLAPMRVPFPELTHLWLWSNDEPPVIPDSFLGGSAPRLRILYLNSFSFPGLPKLLLSATQLVRLDLDHIPHSGYISPQAMVAPLSGLSRLEILFLQFRSPQSRPHWESQSLPTPRRSILPALIEFRFKGVAEYLEELVTRIDSPQLVHMHITFFNQIDLGCPRLFQFINCTPKLRVFDEAHVQFDDTTATVTLRSRSSKFTFDGLLIDVSCREPDWQLSFIEQLLNSSLYPLSVEDLYIKHRYSQLVWKDDAIESTLWLQLFLPFTAVKNLYLTKEFAPRIADTLKELVGGRITEVLPSLQNIFVEALELSGFFQENIGQFAAARQLSDHPIIVSDWNEYADRG